MDFDLTDDQREIKRTARDLLGDALDARRACARPPRRAATTTALWRELRELGWPGIAVAEEHGGQGLGAVELAILLRGARLRRARATPFLATALAGAGDRSTPASTSSASAGCRASPPAS